MPHKFWHSMNADRLFCNPMDPVSSAAGRWLCRKHHIRCQRLQLVEKQVVDTGFQHKFDIACSDDGA